MNGKEQDLMRLSRAELITFVETLQSENKRLEEDLLQWKKWYEQATGFPATKN